MCLPGICDPFDLEDCCGGSGTAAPPARQRPVQQFQSSTRQQRAAAAAAAAAARAPRPTQGQGQGQQMQDTLPTVNVSKTPRGAIVLAGVPRGFPSIQPYEQGQLVSGYLRNVTNSYSFSNAKYYRTRKGLVILQGAQFRAL
ncbi:uncharacterized protein BO72DRAFT_494231 [Aspergillus fijiensis CBS 313.89]|uniref:Uncharacterized protein n=1 Tax=Aspergillus fijiensis CBS 313.89 TaxID=1448319 RepID=A0A8G1W0H9_9EURO|nr:uncharacterized protein BO72DRAFT_494231 [Aspergillus fijiensis CBS 313.89]RAK79367.1 hypothetical protein BO72DRAFT_494231 [Aspergillus fijiensis CBS 313.89]